MSKLKIVKITPEQFDKIMKLGSKHDPFYAKLDLAINSPKGRIKRTKLVVENGPSKTAQIGQAFKDAYFKKFNQHYPTWGVKENSLIKHWLGSVPFERAIELVAIYPQWNNQYVIKSGHPLHLLIKLHHEMWTDRERYIQKEQLKIKAKDQEEHIRIHAKLHNDFDKDERKQIPGYLQGEQSFIPFKD